MTAGDIIDVTPTELVAGGAAMARVDGMPIFILGVFPGDRARIVITEVKKGFARGELRELLAPAPLRREMPCSVAGECGGCDWTALRLDHQLDAKVKILRDSLRRIGKLDPDSLPPIRVHPSPLNYRLRSRLHLSNEKTPALGFFALRSHRVVPLVAECEVVGPAVLARIDDLAADLASSGATSIETFENGRDLVANPIDEESEQGKPVSIVVGGFAYRLSTSAFFQGNRHLLPLLHRLVRRAAEETTRREVAYDLYAGVGFFTLPLARSFKSVFSVEESPLPHRYARQNARGAPNVKTIRRSVEAFLDRGVVADFILVDPPRAGLSPDVTARLGESNAERIAYLSCDPVTFSRDAARLARRGWGICSLDLVDLFPNTHHVETFATFAPPLTPSPRRRRGEGTSIEVATSPRRVRGALGGARDLASAKRIPRRDLYFVLQST
ncbi:MAG TPA: TRAM domain-containing protein [Thermoanaerobaculia bacterium]